MNSNCSSSSLYFPMDLDRIETSFLCQHCEPPQIQMEDYEKQKQAIRKFGVLNENRRIPSAQHASINRTARTRRVTENCNSNSEKRVLGHNYNRTAYCSMENMSTLFRGGFPGGDSEVSSVVDGFFLSCMNSSHEPQSDSYHKTTHVHNKDSSSLNPNTHNYCTTDDEIMAGESATDWQWDRDQNHLKSKRKRNHTGDHNFAGDCGDPWKLSWQREHPFEFITVNASDLGHGHGLGLGLALPQTVIDFDEDFQRDIQLEAGHYPTPLTLTSRRVKDSDEESSSSCFLSTNWTHQLPHFPDMTLWTYEELTHAFAKVFLGGLAFALLYKFIHKANSCQHLQ